MDVVDFDEVGRVAMAKSIQEHGYELTQGLVVMRIYITLQRGPMKDPRAFSRRHCERQVTLKRDLLQHLGIKPGERVDLEKLPNGELRMRAARPTGTIDGFLHSLDGKVKLRKLLSIENINRIAAAGWVGDLDQA